MSYSCSSSTPRWAAQAQAQAQRTPCCQSPNCTPPIIVFVPPFRPTIGTMRQQTPGRAYDYEGELERVLDESFQEQRDPEPRPASERTMARMRREVLKADAQCGICLDNVLAGQTAVVAGCCHAVAHPDCMEKALVVTPCCPFCRWSADC